MAVNTCFSTTDIGYALIHKFSLEHFSNKVLYQLIHMQIILETMREWVTTYRTVTKRLGGT